MASRPRPAPRTNWSADTTELAALIDPIPDGRRVPAWALAWNEATKPAETFDRSGAR